MSFNEEQVVDQDEDAILIVALTTIETTFNEKGGDCAQQENSGQSSYWQLPPPSPF